MTWFDTVGNKPPFEPTLDQARDGRARCDECGQYPKLTSSGALRSHSLPWHHTNYGHPCPGSGTQIQPLPGQLDLALEDSSDASYS